MNVASKYYIISQCWKLYSPTLPIKLSFSCWTQSSKLFFSSIKIGCVFCVQNDTSTITFFLVSGVFCTTIHIQTVFVFFLPLYWSAIVVITTHIATLHGLCIVNQNQCTTPNNHSAKTIISTHANSTSQFPKLKPPALKRQAILFPRLKDTVLIDYTVARRRLTGPF